MFFQSRSILFLCSCSSKNLRWSWLAYQTRCGLHGVIRCYVACKNKKKRSISVHSCMRILISCSSAVDFYKLRTWFDFLSTNVFIEMNAAFFVKLYGWLDSCKKYQRLSSSRALEVHQLHWTCLYVFPLFRWWMSLFHFLIPFSSSALVKEKSTVLQSSNERGKSVQKEGEWSNVSMAFIHFK